MRGSEYSAGWIRVVGGEVVKLWTGGQTTPQGKARGCSASHRRRSPPRFRRKAAAVNAFPSATWVRMRVVRAASAWRGVSSLPRASRPDHARPPPRQRALGHRARARCTACLLRSSRLLDLRPHRPFEPSRFQRHEATDTWAAWVGVAGGEVVKVRVGGKAVAQHEAHIAPVPAGGRCRCGFAGRQKG